VFCVHDSGVFGGVTEVGCHWCVATASDDEVVLLSPLYAVRATRYRVVGVGIRKKSYD